MRGGAPLRRSGDPGAGGSRSRAGRLAACRGIREGGAWRRVIGEASPGACGASERGSSPAAGAGAAAPAWSAPERRRGVLARRRGAGGADRRQPCRSAWRRGVSDPSSPSPAPAGRAPRRAPARRPGAGSPPGQTGAARVSAEQAGRGAARPHGTGPDPDRPAARVGHDRRGFGGRHVAAAAARAGAVERCGRPCPRAGHHLQGLAWAGAREHHPAVGRRTGPPRRPGRGHSKGDASGRGRGSRCGGGWPMPKETSAKPA